MDMFGKGLSADRDVDGITATDWFSYYFIKYYKDVIWQNLFKFPDKSCICFRLRANVSYFFLRIFVFWT